MRIHSRSWTTLLTKLGLKRKSPRKHSINGYNRKLRFEQCEDRRVLATFMVTNTGDGVVTGPGDQPGTLRQAVFDAEFLDGPDRIEFSIEAIHDLNGGTINLTQGHLSITQAVTIDASMLADGITIDASGSDSDTEVDNGGGSRVFSISLGNSGNPEVTLQSLTITGGDYATAGGAIFFDGNFFNATNSGILTTEDCVFHNNYARTDGGAIFARNGILRVYDSQFINNRSEFTQGGGIAVVDGGEVTISDSQFVGNKAYLGGGLSLDKYNTNYIGEVVVTIENSLFEDNEALGSSGDPHG
jgi:predicted outer membrane repeat protein